MLRKRLREFGRDYGDFDAHNGLWEMAEKTAHDGLARMALVPRVLEARGLDVTPGMIVEVARARRRRDRRDPRHHPARGVAHVAAGSRWYRWHCAGAGVEPRARFRELLREYATGVLHKPFNTAGAAGGGLRCARNWKACRPKPVDAHSEVGHEIAAIRHRHRILALAAAAAAPCNQPMAIGQPGTAAQLPLNTWRGFWRLCQLWSDARGRRCADVLHADDPSGAFALPRAAMRCIGWRCLATPENARLTASTLTAKRLH